MGVCIMDDFFKLNDDKFTYSQNTPKRYDTADINFL
ncbi:hypothetical protein PSGL111025_14020 [Psychrobacter glaciei]